ncbi:MAG TPA: hypothetical protein ENN21_05135 [Spirochaetes bacterium]|nr:hypothetical protein [Spirochaetota bacterium]
MNQTRLSGHRRIYGAVIIALIAAAGFFGFYVYLERTVTGDLKNYLGEIYRAERAVVENLPIYEDWTSPEKEQKLRRYLLNDHLEAVRKTGLEPVRNDNEIPALAEKNILKPLDGRERLYYFYNVKKEYRYLAPFAAEGLDLLCRRFQGKLNRKGAVPPVKIAISSAIRPVTYQTDLRKRNLNAGLESSHPYGVSFDIFYDDYFVSLPDASGRLPLSRAVVSTLNRKFGFVLGDSLRRQFRAALAETLMDLQDEGLLYAILEKRQRCYHVTILKK